MNYEKETTTHVAITYLFVKKPLNILLYIYNSPELTIHTL